MSEVEDESDSRKVSMACEENVKCAGGECSASMVQTHPRACCGHLQLLLGQPHGVAVRRSPLAGCLHRLRTCTRNLLFYGLQQQLLLLCQRLDDGTTLSLPFS